MTRLAVVICALAAFAAGWAVGIEMHRPAAPQPATTRPSRFGGWLTSELKLTAEQQEQMKQIWSETARSGGIDRDSERWKLYRERDQAILELIRPEDRARYEEIQQKHSEDVANLERQWRGSFESAVEKTKQILTPEQRAKYEGLLQKRQWDRGPRDRGPHGERGPRDHRGPERSGPPRHRGSAETATSP